MTSTAQSTGLAFFVGQHEHVHAAIRPGISSLENFVCNQLSEAQMRQRPDNHSSIAFLLWHIARFEDVIINVRLHDAPEVLDREGWLARLGVERRDVGVSWTQVLIRDAHVAVWSGCTRLPRTTEPTPRQPRRHIVRNFRLVRGAFRFLIDPGLCMRRD